jgi:hypothetical protein
VRLAQCIEKELKRQITQAEAKAGGKKWKELKRQITQAEAKAGGKK